VKAENAELKRQLEARAEPKATDPVPAPVVASAAPKLDDFINEPDPYAALASAAARFEVQRVLTAERLAAQAAQVEQANAARFEAAIKDDDELPALMEAADAALVQAGADPRAPFPGALAPPRARACRAAAAGGPGAVPGGSDGSAFAASEVVRREAQAIFNDFGELSRLQPKYFSFDLEGKRIFISKIEQFLERCAPPAHAAHAARALCLGRAARQPQLRRVRAC
jgi:hypothetical protein